MSLNPQAYLKAVYPPPLKSSDLRDEDVAYLLDQSDKRSRATRKGQETRRQRKGEKVSAAE